MIRSIRDVRPTNLTCYAKKSRGNNPNSNNVNGEYRVNDLSDEDSTLKYHGQQPVIPNLEKVGDLEGIIVAYLCRRCRD